MFLVYINAPSITLDVREAAGINFKIIKSVMNCNVLKTAFRGLSKEILLKI